MIVLVDARPGALVLFQMEVFECVPTTFFKRFASIFEVPYFPDSIFILNVYARWLWNHYEKESEKIIEPMFAVALVQRLKASCHVAKEHGTDRIWNFDVRSARRSEDIRSLNTQRSNANARYGPSSVFGILIHAQKGPRNP